MVTIGTGPDDPRAWVRAARKLLEAAETAAPGDKPPPGAPAANSPASASSASSPATATTQEPDHDRHVVGVD